MKSQRIPKRFHELVSDLVLTYGLRAMCRELGVVLAPDGPEYRKEQRKKWAEAKSFTTPRHRYKLRLLVKRLAQDKFGI